MGNQLLMDERSRAYRTRGPALGLSESHKSNSGRDRSILNWADIDPSRDWDARPLVMKSVQSSRPSSLIPDSRVVTVPVQGRPFPDPDARSPKHRCREKPSPKMAALTYRRLRTSSTLPDQANDIS
jgi:hypothetical protein